LANCCEWWCTLEGVNDPKDLTLLALSNLLGVHPEDIYFQTNLAKGSYLVESYSKWSPPTNAVAALVMALKATNPEVKATLEWAETASAGAGAYTLSPGETTFKEVLYIPLGETGPWDHVQYKHLKKYLEDMCE